MSAVRRGVALLAVLGCACGAAGGDGALEGQSQAILDGEFATQGQIYGTVALLDAASRLPYCSGTLVAPDVVVTAAHCGLIIDPDTQAVLGERDPADVLVAGGVTSVSSARDEDLYAVADLALHPDFGDREAADSNALTRPLNDIALVALARPIDTMEPVPVLTPDRASRLLAEGMELSIGGYGTSDRAGRFGGGTLRMGEVPLVQLGEDEFIAGQVGTPDSCPGDSGGPVYVESGGTLALVGVTSRGLADATSACGGGGIYTLAPAYLDYLMEVSPSPIDVLGSLRNDDPDEDDEGELPGGDEGSPAEMGVTPGTGPVHAGCSTLPGGGAGASVLAMALGLFALALRRRG
jgi:hypothetical protein